MAISNAIPGDLIASTIVAYNGLVLQSPILDNGVEPLFKMNNTSNARMPAAGYNFTMVKVAPDCKSVAASDGTFLYLQRLDDKSIFVKSANLSSVHDLVYSTDSSTIWISTSAAPYIISFSSTNLTRLTDVTGVPAVFNNSNKHIAYSNYNNIYLSEPIAGTPTAGKAPGFSCINVASNSYADLSMISGSIATHPIIPFPTKNYILACGYTSLNRIFDASNFSLAPLSFTNTDMGVASFKNGFFTADGKYLIMITKPGYSKPCVWKVNYGSSHLDVTFTEIFVPAVAGNFSFLAKHSFRLLGLRHFTASSGSPGSTDVVDGPRIFTINDDDTVTTTRMFNTLVTSSGQPPSWDIVGSLVKRKFAGTVVNAADAPVAREVRIYERRTGRFIESGMSDAVTGAFSITVYTTAPCMVIALGEGSEVTKLVDSVAPVAP